jgi:hypothetical protein
MVVGVRGHRVAVETPRRPRGLLSLMLTGLPGAMAGAQRPRGRSLSLVASRMAFGGRHRRCPECRPRLNESPA